MNSFIYDNTVGKFTREYMLFALDFLPPNSTILDIGIGTGTSLVKNHKIIKEKKLKIIGIDIDKEYISKCIKNIEKYDLFDYIEVYLNDIYTWETDKKFDFIFFSDSYAVIPNVHSMIKYSYKFLNDNGRIIIITALFDSLKPYKNFIKKNIVNVIGVEFGETMLKDELLKFLNKESINCTIEKIKSHFFIFFGRSDIYLIIFKPKIN